MIQWTTWSGRARTIILISGAIPGTRPSTVSVRDWEWVMSSQSPKVRKTLKSAFSAQRKRNVQLSQNKYMETTFWHFPLKLCSWVCSWKAVYNYWPRFTFALRKEEAKSEVCLEASWFLLPLPHWKSAVGNSCVYHVGGCPEFRGDDDDTLHVRSKCQCCSQCL